MSACEVGDLWFLFPETSIDNTRLILSLTRKGNPDMIYDGQEERVRPWWGGSVPPGVKIRAEEWK